MTAPPPGFLILTDDQLGNLGINTSEVVTAIEAAFASQASATTWTAPKSALLPGDGRYMMTTLSASDSPRITAVKSVMVSPRNPARGMNGVEGAILLQDSETGHLLAVMQAGWVTAVRTPGLSALAAKRLANPASDTVAFIGTGQQARSHLATYADLFPLRRVLISGRGQPNIDRLTAQARDMGLEAKSMDPQEALPQADLVVTSITLSFDTEPFLDARTLKPGAHATITDAGIPWHDAGMSAFGTVIIDDLAQERESANKMIAPDLVSDDLAGFLANPTSPAYDPVKPSAFIFRGMAIGDFAIAALAYQRAREAGVGQTVNW